MSTRSLASACAAPCLAFHSQIWPSTFAASVEGCVSAWRLVSTFLHCLCVCACLSPLVSLHSYLQPCTQPSALTFTSPSTQQCKPESARLLCACARWSCVWAMWAWVQGYWSRLAYKRFRFALALPAELKSHKALRSPECAALQATRATSAPSWAFHVVCCHRVLLRRPAGHNI